MKRFELNRAGSFQKQGGWLRSAEGFPGQSVAEAAAGSKAGRVRANMLFSDRRPLRERWERKRCLVEESQLGEESRMRRFLLLGRYQGTTAGYLGSRVVGQNFIFRRDFLGIVDFFFSPKCREAHKRCRKVSMA